MQEVKIPKEGISPAYDFKFRLKECKQLKGGNYKIKILLKTCGEEIYDIILFQ